MLYYVSGSLETYILNAMDQEVLRRLPIKLVTHEIADKFIASPYNLPWVKIPVCYIEDKYIYVIYDSINKPEVSSSDDIYISYIKKPNTFVKDLDKLSDASELWKNISHDGFSRGDLDLLDETTLSYFFFSNDMDLEDVDAGIRNAYNAVRTYLNSLYTFECNDTMAEELISLAVSFALENVESQRLNSKLNMRGLEA